MISGEYNSINPDAANIERKKEELLDEMKKRSDELHSILQKSESEQDELLRYFEKHAADLVKAYEFEPEVVIPVLKKMCLTIRPKEVEFRATKFHYYGLNKIVQLLPKLQSDIKNGKPMLSRLETIFYLTDSEASSLDFQNKGVESLYALLPEISANFNTYNGFVNYSPFIVPILRYGGVMQRAAVEKVIWDSAQSYSEEERFRALFILCVNADDYPEVCKKYFWQKLESLKLPAAEICEAWAKGSKKDELRYALSENFKLINSIEEKRPGICEVLNKEFGIKNFARYPIDLLVDQYDHRDDKDVQYGIIVTPVEDYNGSQYRNQGIYNNMHRALKNKIHLRVVECESRGHFVRKLNELDGKYNSEPGVNNEISLLYFGGHGSEDSICLGDSGEKQKIRVKDLKGSRLGKVKSYFKKKCIAILASCSTGKVGGFAETLTQELDFVTYASDKVGSLHSLDVRFDEQENPVFDLEYISKRIGIFKGLVYGGK